MQIISILMAGMHLYLPSDFSFASFSFLHSFDPSNPQVYLIGPIQAMAVRFARASMHRRAELAPCYSQKLPAGRSSNANITTASVAAMEYCYALVTAGVSLVLYYNTLGADFAYDDR